MPTRTGSEGETILSLAGTGTRIITATAAGLLGNATSIDGNYIHTGTLSASNLSGTNTGDQTNISGNAATATALQTARAINGVNFDGTAAITVTAAAGTLSGATLAAGVTASSLESVGTLAGVAISGGSGATGKIYTTAADGTVIWAKAGSGTDFLLAHSGGGNVFDVPTGTATAQFYGKITSNLPTGGIGYRAGAGGTVTQATSKATGVTLSNVSGQITLNAASLAANAIVSFTLTNTAIAATDILVMNHASGGTVGAYAFNAQCGAGSAVINVTNLTAGALAEAVVIGFVLVKGVTA